MPRPAPLLNYVKAAFIWHWNLLAFGAGVVFSVISFPSMMLPLVLAGEIAFLGLLSTHPKFRKAIDARSARSSMTPPPIDSAPLLDQIKGNLKGEAWDRFDTLRKRCLELETLTRQFKGPAAQDTHDVGEMQTGSLERLLWMFLKLLYSLDALQKFLKRTDRDALARQVTECDKELTAARAAKRDDRLLRALEDKLETLKQRLANYDRANDNRDFLRVEIDRIEQKVNAISEMAMSSRDASEITAQVDGIAAGMSATEQAMRELDVAPMFQQEDAPKFLREEA